MKGFDISFTQKEKAEVIISICVKLMFRNPIVDHISHEYFLKRVNYLIRCNFSNKQNVTQMLIEIISTK